jgi:hypothetical protein
MDAVRLKNAGTIDMSSPPNAFGPSHRTGPSHARTFQTYARIETAPRHGLQACLSKHELVMPIPPGIPENLRLKCIGQRILQLSAQPICARIVGLWLSARRSARCDIIHALH